MSHQDPLFLQETRDSGTWGTVSFQSCWDQDLKLQGIAIFLWQPLPPALWKSSLLFPFLSHTPQIYTAKQRAVLLLQSCSLVTEVTRSAETTEMEIWERKWLSDIPAVLPHGRVLGHIPHFGHHSC